MNERKIILDLLRSLAILGVLLLHSLEFMKETPYAIRFIFAHGWIGVDLFFVLSGFLIGQQAFKENDFKFNSIIKFLIKRIFRTLPLYYFVLIVYVLVKPHFGYPFIGDPIPYFFLIQNFFSPRDFAQSWSLCIEEQFYLIFPFSYTLIDFKKWPPYLLLFPGFFSVFYRLFLYLKGAPATDPPEIGYTYQFPFFTHLDGICWGLFLARTMDSWKNFQNKKWWAWGGVVLLFITLLYSGFITLNSTVILTFQLLAISFSLIIIGTYDVKSLPMEKGIEWFAILSYGMYLWNNLVAKMVTLYFKSLPEFFQLIFFIFMTIIISFITYLMIEKPFLKLRNRVLNLIP